MAISANLAVTRVLQTRVDPMKPHTLLIAGASSTGDGTGGAHTLTGVFARGGTGRQLYVLLSVSTGFSSTGAATDGVQVNVPGGEWVIPNTRLVGMQLRSWGLLTRQLTPGPGKAQNGYVQRPLLLGMTPPAGTDGTVQVIVDNVNLNAFHATIVVAVFDPKVTERLYDLFQDLQMWS